MVRVMLDLPDWVAEALTEWQIPEEHCGASLAERLEWLADDMALRVQGENKRRKLSDALGITDKTGDNLF